MAAELTPTEVDMLREARQRADCMRDDLLRITYLLRRLPGGKGWVTGRRWLDRQQSMKEATAAIKAGERQDDLAVHELKHPLTEVHDAVIRLRSALQDLHDTKAPKPKPRS